MTPLLFKLLQQITDHDIASAYSSVIELDRYAKNKIDGAEWMTALVDELAKTKNKPPTWTTTKPTQGGFYWYCEKGHDFPKDAEVIEIDVEYVSMGTRVFQFMTEYSGKIECFDGYFAGPISKPEMPT